MGNSKRDTADPQYLLFKQGMLVCGNGRNIEI